MRQHLNHEDGLHGVDAPKEICKCFVQEVIGPLSGRADEVVKFEGLG